MASNMLAISTAASSKQSTNTSADTTEFDLASFVIPANTLREGDILRIRSAWRMSNTATGKLLRIYVGSTRVRNPSVASFATDNDATDIGIGAGYCVVTPSLAAVGAFGTSGSDFTTVAVDWTQDQTITFRGVWSAAVASEFIELRMFTIERMRLG